MIVWLHSRINEGYRVSLNFHAKPYGFLIATDEKNVEESFRERFKEFVFVCNLELPRKSSLNRDLRTIVG